MKIVFFRYLPLTQKVVEDFYMEDLVSFGYDVDYWDITSLYFSDQKGLESYIPRKEEKISVKYIQSRKEFINLLKENNDALFISIMSFGPKLIWIFHNMKRFGCRTAVFSYYPLPLHVGSGSKKEKLFDLKRVVNGLYTRVSVFLAVKMRYINLYDYVFKGGSLGWKGIGSVKLDYLKNTTFLEVNNWDYDKFLQASPMIKKDKYLVFLDEYYPFHPDALLFGQHSVQPEQYYNDLNKVFSVLEEYYGMPVVIAAHPKALKYKCHNYFEGREVKFNCTLDLVASASYVLAHDSLSIGYAVMCMKPLIFINSNEIMQQLPHESNTIIAFSEYFHSSLVYPETVSFTRLPEGDLSDESRQVYHNLREGYMTTLTDGQTNVELLKGYMKTIFKRLLR